MAPGGRWSRGVAGDAVPARPGCVARPAVAGRADRLAQLGPSRCLGAAGARLRSVAAFVGTAYPREGVPRPVLVGPRHVPHRPTGGWGVFVWTSLISSQSDAGFRGTDSEPATLTTWFRVFGAKRDTLATDPVRLKANPGAAPIQKE